MMGTQALALRLPDGPRPENLRIEIADPGAMWARAERTALRGFINWRLDKDGETLRPKAKEDHLDRLDAAVRRWREDHTSAEAKTEAEILRCVKALEEEAMRRPAVREAMEEALSALGADLAQQDLPTLSLGVWESGIAECFAGMPPASPGGLVWRWLWYKAAFRANWHKVARPAPPQYTPAALAERVASRLPLIALAETWPMAAVVWAQVWSPRTVGLPERGGQVHRSLGTISSAEPSSPFGPLEDGDRIRVGDRGVSPWATLLPNEALQEFDEQAHRAAWAKIASPDLRDTLAALTVEACLQEEEEGRPPGTVVIRTWAEYLPKYGKTISGERIKAERERIGRLMWPLDLTLDVRGEPVRFTAPIIKTRLERAGAVAGYEFHERFWRGGLSEYTRIEPRALKILPLSGGRGRSYARALYLEGLHLLRERAGEYAKVGSVSVLTEDLFGRLGMPEDRRRDKKTHALQGAAAILAEHGFLQVTLEDQGRAASFVPPEHMAPDLQSIGENYLKGVAARRAHARELAERRWGKARK